MVHFIRIETPMSRLTAKVILIGSKSPVANRVRITNAKMKVSSAYLWDVNCFATRLKNRLKHIINIRITGREVGGVNIAIDREINPKIKAGIIFFDKTPLATLILMNYNHLPW